MNKKNSCSATSQSEPSRLGKLSKSPLSPPLWQNHFSAGINIWAPPLPLSISPLLPSFFHFLSFIFIPNCQKDPSPLLSFHHHFYQSSPINPFHPSLLSRALTSQAIEMINSFLTTACAVLCFLTFFPLFTFLILSDIVRFLFGKAVGYLYPIIDGKLSGKYSSYDIAKTMISLLVRFAIFISSDGSSNEACISPPDATHTPTPITDGPDSTESTSTAETTGK